MAHRGVKSLYPENTLAAFNAASVLNIPWIETDVTLSKDNVPIITHDHVLNVTDDHVLKLKRSAGLKKKDVWDMSLKEIKQIDVGSCFSPRFKKERILTLGELINFVNVTGMKLNLEIKAEKKNKAKWNLLAEIVYKAIRKKRAKKSDLIISSFCVSILQYIHKRDANLKLGLLADEKVNKNWSTLMKKLPYYSIHLKHPLIKESIVKKTHEHGCKLYVWTVNNKRKAQTFAKWKVDGVISDCPQNL